MSTESRSTAWSPSAPGHDEPPSTRLAALAQSPQACAAVLESTLKACTRGGHHVVSAEPREAIAGRRGKAFLRLDATLLDTSTGTEHARAFVFEFFADDDGRKVRWRLLRRQAGTDAGLFVGYLPAQRLLVRELAYDYRLDTLAAALEPGALSAAASSCVADWGTSGDVPAIVRYVPEKRALLRLRSGPRTLLAKVYGRDEDLAVAAVQARLFSQLAGSAPVVAAVRGVLPAFRVVLQEEVQGESIYERLRAAQAPPALQSGAAAALAAVHAVPVPGLRLHALVDELDVVAGAVLRSPLADADRSTANVLLGRLRHRASSLSPRPLGFVHRDFYDKQVIVSGNRHVIIDFDTARTSFAELDVANHAAHLALRAAQGYVPQPQALSHARTFVDAYRRTGRPIDGALLRWSAASTWLRLATVYAARPAWRALPARLLALAAAALDNAHADSTDSLSWTW